MRHESLYLNDIVEATADIVQFIAGIEPAAFQASDLLRSAVVHKLAVIGEAAARLSDDLKERNPQASATFSSFSSMRTLESTGTSFGKRPSTDVPNSESRLLGF